MILQLLDSPGGLEAAPGGIDGRTLQVQLERLEGEGPWEPEPVEEVGGPPPEGPALPGVVEIGGTLLLGEGPFVALGGPPLLVCGNGNFEIMRIRLRQTDKSERERDRE